MNLDQHPVAPASVVESTQPTMARADTPPFFAVSLGKLLLMYFCTLGFYQVYWFYKNWYAIRERTGENIMPFWRAFFSVLFCYPLFSRMKRQIPESSAISIHVGASAAAWIVLAILVRLPDPYWLVSFFGAVFVLLPIQAAVNGINQRVAPDYERNSQLSGWNWIAVIVGYPFMLLCVYAALFIAR